MSKTVLITGGTGSFGKAFIREKLSEFSRLVVFSRDELKQHQFRTELGDPKKISWQIGDVRDKERVYRSFEGVDTVIHAAALKQVPACEYNPYEAVKTNVVGAQNVIDAAIDRGVQKVIALSSDKAVNPINLYGATKLCSEKLFVQGNSYAGGKNTRFSCVRYGNVLASRGSLLSLVKEQRPSGYITVTDANMTRFWMTITQAVSFVSEALSLMRGGEIFVPQIPSMAVVEMVKALAPECRVKYIGVRPGEKMHEVLIAPDEVRRTVIQPGSTFHYNYIIKPEHTYWGDVEMDGIQAKDSFASNTNDRWLDREELLKLVGVDKQYDHCSGDPLIAWADDETRFLGG